MANAGGQIIDQLFIACDFKKMSLKTGVNIRSEKLSLKRSAFHKQCDNAASTAIIILTTAMLQRRLCSAAKQTNRNVRRKD